MNTSEVKFSNYTPDNRFYISTIYRNNIWETAVFSADPATRNVSYDMALDEEANASQEAALACHGRMMYRWSGTARAEDVLGIGEGYY